MTHFKHIQFLIPFAHVQAVYTGDDACDVQVAGVRDAFTLYGDDMREFLADYEAWIEPDSLVVETVYTDEQNTIAFRGVMYTYFNELRDEVSITMDGMNGDDCIILRGCLGALFMEQYRAWLERG